MKKHNFWMVEWDFPMALQHCLRSDPGMYDDPLEKLI